MSELEKKISATPEVEPSQEDLQAIARIKKRDDRSEGITPAQMDLVRAEKEYNGNDKKSNRKAVGIE